jgi:hypothetical protein
MDLAQNLGHGSGQSRNPIDASVFDDAALGGGDIGQRRRIRRIRLTRSLAGAQSQRT